MSTKITTSIINFDDIIQKYKYDVERFKGIKSILAEILSEYTEISNDKVKKLFCNEEGYQITKIYVRLATFKDNKNFASID